MIGSDSVRLLHTVLGNRSLQRSVAGFMLYAAAECGEWVAILVYGYNIGGPTWSAISCLVGLVPSTLFAPVGALIGDRMRRERALAWGYAAQAFTMGLTAFAMFAEQPPWVVYPCAALAGCSLTLTRPVYSAMLSSLCRTPEELTAANAVTSWAEGLGVFGGPILSGMLVAMAAPYLAFAGMAVTQILALALALGVTPGQEGSRERVDEELGNSLARMLAEGFREARNEQGVWLLLFLVSCQFAIMGMLDVLNVALAFSVLDLGPSGPGLLIAGLGVGGLFGAMAAMIRPGRRRLAAAFVVGALANGIPLLVFGIPFQFGLITALVLLMTAGGGKSFADVTARTLLQRTVRDDALARVFGLQESLAMAGMALGSIAAPILVEWFGERGAFVAAGFFLPLTALVSWKRLRTLDDRAHVPKRELEILRKIPLFKPLTPLVLERLASRLVPANAVDGEAIIKQGDPGNLFYIVDDGTVSVTASGRQLAVLGRADYFGEIALLRNVPRSANVTARGDVKLLTLERREFLTAVTGSSRSADIAHVEIERRLDAHADEQVEQAS
jgi:MFS family permease